MWGRLGPRFAVEAGFLILVAVALGFAELRPLLIVIVMGVAWLLVSLIELIASRQSRYPVVVQRTAVSATAPAAPGASPADASATAPAGAVPVHPAHIAVGGATEETRPEASAPEDGLRDEGSDLEPPARRRWFRRREQPGEAPAEEGAVEIIPAEEPRPDNRAEGEPAGEPKRRRWFAGRDELGATPVEEKPGGGQATAAESPTDEPVGEEPASGESSPHEGETDATEPARRRSLRRPERPAHPPFEQAGEGEPVSADSPVEGVEAAPDRVSDEVSAAERGGEEDRS